MNKNFFIAGFSLIEVLVVLAIFSFVAAAGLYSFTSARSGVSLDEGTASLLHAFERARSRALTGVGTSNHGVHIKEKEIVEFEGTAYTAGEGLSYPLPPNVSTDHTGTTIIFSRLSGKPDSGIVVNLSGLNDTSGAVTVTAEGAIIRE